MGARTEPRFTRDVDIAVQANSDKDAEALVRSLMARGYGVLTVVEQKAMNRMATVRLSTPTPKDGTIVDLLFASSGIEPEVVAGAEVLELFAEVFAPVARLPHLVAMKLLSRDDEHREQDRSDLRKLVAIASAGELEEVRSLVHLIVARGYNRGRDLQAALDGAVKEWRPSND